MSRKNRMSPGKKNMITSLIEAYDIKTASDLQDALKDLLGDTIEGMLESELDEELGYEKNERTEDPKTNYRNGYKPKTLKSTIGELEIEVPQDRNAEFEPLVVPKYKRDISEIEDIYGFKISSRMAF